MSVEHRCVCPEQTKRDSVPSSCSIGHPPNPRRSEHEVACVSHYSPSAEVVLSGVSLDRHASSCMRWHRRRRGVIVAVR